MVSWNKLSYEKRNKILLLGSVAFIVVIYLLSISNTVDLYFKNEQLKEKLSQAEGAPQKIAIYEKKLMFWDQLAASFTDSTQNIQKELFSRVGKACNDNRVTLKSLQFTSSEQKESHRVDTYQVVMEGSYKGLLQATYQLENQLGNGVLSSVSFEKQYDRQTKRNYLIALLYIQSIQ